MLERLSEGLSLVSCIDPDVYVASTVNGDVIDMKDFRRVIFVLMAGTLGASATLDYAIYGDTASGGSFATQITGKAATQLTQAGTDSDKQVIIEVTAEEAAAQGFRYLQDEMIVAVATSDCGAVALADRARYSDASGLDLSTVDEIVT